MIKQKQKATGEATLIHNNQHASIGESLYDRKNKKLTLKLKGVRSSSVALHKQNEIISVSLTSTNENIEAATTA
jgi:hypothetical protein